jgi:hypothetical protein
MEIFLFYTVLFTVVPCLIVAAVSCCLKGGSHRNFWIHFSKASMAMPWIFLFLMLGGICCGTGGGHGSPVLLLPYFLVFGLIWTLLSYMFLGLVRLVTDGDVAVEPYNPYTKLR